MEGCVATAAKGWGTDAYGVSKAALNALTRIVARELAPRRIRVNSTCSVAQGLGPGALLLER
jgi:NAD(P)-dependent dehydrogenase (short-subunit alcohol dehydrogenase family)